MKPGRKNLETFIFLFLLFATSLYCKMVHDRFRTLYSVEQLKKFNFADIEVESDRFLIPRISGSEGNYAVQEHIKKTFEKLGWDIQIDRFSDTTPIGDVEFTNIVVTKDPFALRRLTLACHYDSKNITGAVFIGATDSAVPCGMLVGMAKSLNDLLNMKMQTVDRFTTVQIIFFDGEEAVIEWNDKDSIYGARHLAKLWNETPLRLNVEHPINGFDWGRGIGLNEHETTQINQMDSLILLDLLGTAEAKIYNIHRKKTDWIWQRLLSIQSRIVEAGISSDLLRRRVKYMLDGGVFQSSAVHFLTETSMQDDHLPFMNLGVPIVHCIPYPFPSVWHTVADDKSAIDFDISSDLQKIFSILVAEYLGLSV